MRIHKKLQPTGHLSKAHNIKNKTIRLNEATRAYQQMSYKFYPSKPVFLSLPWAMNPIKF